MSAAQAALQAQESLPSLKVLLTMYQKMVAIRRFEETAGELYRDGKMPGFPHLYIGEEASAVGICSQLKPEDYITSNHRGHGHCIAKGGDLKKMVAEILGKKTGYCKGKGGTMHIADPDIGILGANGIVGAGIPLAVGSGLTARLKKTGRVTVCFFGDGASNQGAFHEGLNLASIWKLPVIFACENNLYQISMCQRDHMAIKDIATRGVAYGIPGVVVDGNDVLDVYQKAGEAVARARAGEGPTLLEMKTYRWRGHTEADPTRGLEYRPKEELEAWMARDPIKLLEERLLGWGLAKESRLKAIRKSVEDELAEAVRFAEESPLPEPEEALEDVYAP
ncbi:MAG: thiamine pyrophosphate-dependent dehydrogenase E1 component subunit alpha [Chloroflexi bacterium]|nr:thiamine pyrophosphate-dependent dehydrogenase E1 component subunit alpha [Chloroflexota bacterium]